MSSAVVIKTLSQHRLGNPAHLQMFFFFSYQSKHQTFCYECCWVKWPLQLQVLLKGETIAHRALERLQAILPSHQYRPHNLFIIGANHEFISYIVQSSETFSENEIHLHYFQIYFFKETLTIQRFWKFETKRNCKTKQGEINKGF